MEWLSDRTGILEGSELPVGGISVAAAHNMLNDREYGSFSLLSTMEPNELITVSERGDVLRNFRVFANEILSPDDMEKKAAIVGSEENTLVLIARSLSRNFFRLKQRVLMREFYCSFSKPIRSIPIISRYLNSSPLS